MTPPDEAATARRYEAAVAALWAGAAEGPAADGAHDIGHLRRVWANAQAIAAGEGGGADRAVLMAAAFFHDVVNLPKAHPDRAAASARSAAVAVDWLSRDGFAPDRLPAVAHAITAHSFSAGVAPQTAEARILQDADRLEALGAIGLARMFHVAGQMGAGLFDADDPLAQHRPPDDRRHALDHLEVKLFRLPDLMQTATGRAMASARVAFMQGFRDRLLDEASPGA